MKQLWGIRHTEDTLQKIIWRINQESLLNIGLEISKESLEEEAVTNYFKEISRDLMNCGIKVIPLDPYEFEEESFAIYLAMDIIKGEGEWGKSGKESLIGVIDKMRFFIKMNDNYFIPQEMIQEIAGYSYLLRRYEQALNILEKNYSLETLTKMEKKINEKRDQHMLEIIIQEKPELVIVGQGHAVKLKEKLLDYEYVDLTDVNNNVS